MKGMTLSPADGFYQVLIKMLRAKYILVFVLAGWFFARCTETAEWDVDSVGWNYYPIEVGSSRVYEVKGVRYINYLDSTEFEYLLKETVVDSFQNLENGISFTLLREKMYDDSSVWETDSIWSIRKDELRAILVENNVPTIQLTFPLEESKVWNSNALNDHDTDEFEMIDIGSTYTGAGKNYSNTVTVIQEDLPEYNIRYISKKEVFAADKGLVYKENVDLVYKQGDFYGKQVVESGIKYYQYLVE